MKECSENPSLTPFLRRNEKLQPEILASERVNPSPFDADSYLIFVPKPIPGSFQPRPPNFPSAMDLIARAHTAKVLMVSSLHSTGEVCMYICVCLYVCL